MSGERNGDADRARVRPVCPSCRNSLAAESDGPSTCSSCGAVYSRIPSGHLRLLPGDAGGFRDWWLDDEQKRARFMGQYVEREEAGERRLAREFLLPLTRQLAGQGPLRRVLSVGCGSGEDLELLRGAGLDTCGVDSGGRTLRWGDKERSPDRYFMADALQLPFTDGEFDLAYSLGVIEHVGTVGDSLELAADAGELRRRFAASVARVVRPGGWIFISCPNRTFLFDFAHGAGRFGFRFHGPGDFLLSYGDVKRLFIDHAGCQSIRPLSMKGYLDLAQAAAGGGMLMRMAAPLFGLYLHALPRPLYTSPLYPAVLALIKR
jgi:SAM-dependent methyltransferase